MQGLMQDWPLRLPRILDHAAQQHGTREIVSREADGSVVRTTYAGLRAHAMRIAAQLRRDGIGPGDRVGTFAWNGADHLAAWFAAVGLGAVYHTINPRLFSEQIGYIIRHAGDRVILADGVALPGLARLVADCPALERVIVLGPPGAPPPSPVPDGRSLAAWLGSPDPAFRWVEGPETEAAGLCYTSGTTGDPKGVLYSHRSTVLHAMLVTGQDVTALRASDTVMPVVPMFHVNAWGLPFAAPMVGAKLVLPGSRLDAASLCALIEDEGVTIAAGVPTILTAMLDHLRGTGRRPPALERLLVGGSACPASVIAAFEREFGIEVRHAWGMTETSPVASTATLKPPLDRIPVAEQLRVRARQGAAPFGVEMKIVDEAGTPLPWDGTTFGRLMVRGFGVTRGYFGEAAPVLDPEGFFDTGDIATIDPHGVMGIVDRSKDVIKSGGEWISSIAIETLAVEHADVAQAAVIGVPHPRWGERPLLVVVPREGTAPSAATLLPFLAARMPRWAVPDDVLLRPSLPLTATGKVSKRLLREEVALLSAAAGDGEAQRLPVLPQVGEGPRSRG